MELEKYTQYQETRKHGHPGFSYDTYLCTIPLDFPRVDLHWHDQMEIIYVKRGSGIISVDLQPYPVCAGCIMPVLPGELHGIEHTGQEPMEYENIIFSLSILDSTETDDWCRNHVINALRQHTLRFKRPIAPGADLHRDASAALDAADMACENRMAGYSLIVKSQLFLFLHALYRHRDKSAASSARTAETDKLKKLLSYVKEHYQEQITVSDAVAEYIIALTTATRRFPGVVMGASPRASRALYRAAKAWAAMAGRSFVTPDDVKYLAPYVLAHRLQLGSESRLSGLTAQAVVARILQETPVPPEKARLFDGKE